MEKGSSSEKFADNLKLTEEEKEIRKAVVDSLNSELTEIWLNCYILVFGSAVSDLALKESDVDVSVFPKGLTEPVSRETEEERLTARKTEEEDVELIGHVLEEKYPISTKVILGAKVPIVKFKDPTHKVDVDVSVGKLDGYLASCYLCALQSLDPRVSRFILIVKHWAKQRGINSSYQGTLSSYSWCLVCINFLQRRNPRILPVLQREHINTTFAAFKKDMVQKDMVQKDMVRSYKNVFELFPRENGESLTELLSEFFCYYDDGYNYLEDVISTCTGSTMKRAKEQIVIEDPFGTGSNIIIKSVSGLRRIRDEFKRANQMMSDEEKEDGKSLEIIC